MKKAILGKKLGMTQIFAEDGTLIPVTVIEAGPCSVVQKKTVEVDGYSAVQVGFQDKKEKNVNKPMKGHFAKAGVAPKRYLRELKLDNAGEMNVGDEIKVDVFAEGDVIDVTGISKGHGYAGTIKRWGTRQPLSQRTGFTRRLFFAFKSIQGQEASGSLRCGQGYNSKPYPGKNRYRTQSPFGKGLCSGSQGRIAYS